MKNMYDKSEKKSENAQDNLKQKNNDCHHI